MTENQKLREALQIAESALADIGDADREPGDDLAWCERRAAQDLPTIRQALALPTAEQVDDINVAESFTSVTKTAPPVVERYSVKHEITQGGYRLFTVTDSDSQCSEDVFPDDNPVLYGLLTELGSRAALSAGDAVDAQRYRWLMDNCTLGIKQNGVGWILNTSACVAPDCIKDVGSAIDAAMRKGQP